MDHEEDCWECDDGQYMQEMKDSMKYYGKMNQTRNEELMGMDMEIDTEVGVARCRKCGKKCGEYGEAYNHAKKCTEKMSRKEYFPITVIGGKVVCLTCGKDFAAMPAQIRKHECREEVCGKVWRGDMALIRKQVKEEVMRGEWHALTQAWKNLKDSVRR